MDRIDLDPEAQAIAWARAERVGLRAQYEPITDPIEAARAAIAADPATAILYDEEDVLERAAGFTQTGGATVIDLGITTAQWADIAIKINDAFAVLGPLWHHVVEMLEPSPAPVADDERRRHGSASVCPRHGPTKAGLCHRCAR